MEAIEINATGELATSTGTVIEAGDTVLRVWSSGTVLDARRAVSCLIAPEEGDLVLLAGPIAEERYVLAVLDRAADARPTRVALAGDVTIDLPSGRFTVAAAEGVSLVSREGISLAADRVEAHARAADLFVGTISLVARAVDVTLERLFQSAKRVLRRVEEIDHLRAGHIDHAAAGTVRLHGEHTLVSARELVKTDGKQIHIG